MPIAVIDMKDPQGTVSDVIDMLSKTSGVRMPATGVVGCGARISVRELEGNILFFFVDGTPLSYNS